MYAMLQDVSPRLEIILSFFSLIPLLPIGHFVNVPLVLFEYSDAIEELKPQLGPVIAAELQEPLNPPKHS
jgi:hypothetical protein